MQVLMKEDSDNENEEKNNNDNASPINETNFYKAQEYRNFDESNDYQEDIDQNINEEIEKPIELSIEKSEEKQKILPKSAMNFEYSSSIKSKEELQGRQEKSQPKQRKHNFNSKLDDQVENDSFKGLESNQIVEETPENQDQASKYEEVRIIAKDPVRNSQQRKYKAWERTDYKKLDKEHIDPEQEYNTIAERIRNRNKISDIEYKEEIAKTPEPAKEEAIIESPIVKNLAETSEAITKSSNQMMNRLQSLKEQCNNIENNMEIMMEASKNMYFDPKQKQEKIRNTINMQPNNYIYERSNLTPKEEPHSVKSSKTFSYGKESPNVKISLFDNKQSNEFESREQVAKIESPYSRNSEATQISMLIEEIKFMKAQQSKILENQNIFQTYISNEITSIKNRMNVLESDILLSKTLNTGATKRSDLGSF